MTEQQREANNEARQEETARVMSSLYGLGLLWARHGLEAGRAALHTSARTLEVCAGTLSQISESLRERE